MAIGQLVTVPETAMFVGAGKLLLLTVVASTRFPRKTFVLAETGASSVMRT